MDKEMKEELREIVSSCSSQIMTTVEAQNEIINNKLDGINEHLTNINGRVNKHDEQIFEALTERAKNREEQRENFKDLKNLKPKVRELEDSQLTSKSVKKWLVGSVAVTGALVAIILSLVHLFTKLPI